MLLWCETRGKLSNDQRLTHEQIKIITSKCYRQLKSQLQAECSELQRSKEQAVTHMEGGHQQSGEPPKMAPQEDIPPVILVDPFQFDDQGTIHK